MTIFFCGDPHGKFQHIIDACRVHRPEAVVLLGDIEPVKPLDQELSTVECPVWWIHGNHDTDSDLSYDGLFASTWADRNLDGRVVTISGRRIAGLGGIWRDDVWGAPSAPKHENPEIYLTRHPKERWRGGLLRKHRSSIWWDTYNALLSEAADILVTHEAPSCHPHGQSAVDDLGYALGVGVMFHGHHHEDRTYPAAEVRMGFRAVGVGKRSIVDEDGRIIVSGSAGRKTVIVG